MSGLPILRKHLVRFVIVTYVAPGPGLTASEILVAPRLVGEWWTVAGKPDLGPLTASRQQPVDFGICQAAEGTWQLWSCIRHTAEPGNTRWFHRWEGANLTNSDWTPKGIALQADPTLKGIRITRLAWESIR